jgi:hypothetical protein
MGLRGISSFLGEIDLDEDRVALPEGATTRALPLGSVFALTGGLLLGGLLLGGLFLGGLFLGGLFLVFAAGREIFTGGSGLGSSSGESDSL